MSFVNVPRVNAVPVKIASVSAVWIAVVSIGNREGGRLVVRMYAELMRKEYSWRHSSQRKKLL